MSPDESNNQDPNAREQITSSNDDEANDANGDAFEALLEAIDEGLARGSTTNIADVTTVPPDLAAELHGVQDCLSLLHTASRTGQLDDLISRGIPRPPAASPVPNSLDRVGRFEILHELGRGGYGIVFLARDPDVGRRVALKVPRPEAIVTPELRRRFLREAEAAGSLQHPNLVAMYEVGEDGPLCYLVTAYCNGPTLAQWLMDHKALVSPREAAALVQSVAEGVAHAHQNGVLHRDIKPSNVLLEPKMPLASDDGLSAFTPKLTDFGHAKLLERPNDETRTGTLLGTPAYMAPEQAAGRLRDISAATDVYGLGAVLYEVLTGQPPFRGENDPDTLRQVCVEEPISPSRLRPDLPRLAGDLPEVPGKEALESLSIRRGIGLGPAALPSGQTHVARPATRWQRILKWSRRKPATAALVGVVVAAAICLVSVVGAYTIQLGTAWPMPSAGRAKPISSDRLHKKTMPPCRRKPGRYPAAALFRRHQVGERSLS